MLGWLNKRLKVALVRNALAQEGVANVYPDALIKDMVEHTFVVTKCLKKEAWSGSAFDFDGNWNAYLHPYIKLLTMNAMFGLAQGRMTGDQVREALRLAVSRAPDGIADLDTLDTDEVDALLRSHDQPSHMGAIRELIA